MTQLNIKIDDDLYKRTKMAVIEYGTTLIKWVSAALETALEDAKTAKNIPGPDKPRQPEIIEPED